MSVDERLSWRYEGFVDVDDQAGWNEQRVAATSDLNEIGVLRDNYMIFVV